MTNLTKFHIFFTVQFSYSREIIHWHEIARTGFLKCKIIFLQYLEFAWTDFQIFHPIKA